jgi:copper homeostasis protein
LSKILLEIIALSPQDCVASEKGGADRIELCAAIEIGGVTPPFNVLIEAKQRVNVPVMALVRPRGGDFCYSDEEFAQMLRDAKLLLQQGADGIVFGILRPDAKVDMERCREMLAIADGKQAVFHRAFDVVADPFQALDQLIDMGFSRVLTSGQQKTALEGVNLIRELIVRSRGRIEILPGGGVRTHNVRQLVKMTNCRQVHRTAFRSEESASGEVDPRIVATMRDILTDIASG